MNINYKAATETAFENTLQFARTLDQLDELKDFRNRFYIPQRNLKDAIYLTGNSLGLQPRNVKDYIHQELNDWANLGVEGHTSAKNPWVTYHELFPEKLSKIVGALPEEVVVMNQLTTNLHLLLISFYRPTKQRYKIICESKAFPSDQYAIESQVQLHGLKPEESIVTVGPRPGEHTIRLEDILNAIEQHKHEAALVLFGGVNYYTGQVFNMQQITEAAHAAGALAGFDLAHGAGNIPLQLHNWNVDFACWCSYKYLNAGPGAVAAVFIHAQHASNTQLPRLAGWWGHNKATRFLMPPVFEPIASAEGWQLSNAPVLAMAALHASLALFEEAGMEALVQKSRQLTGYLFFVIDEINKEFSNPITIITPRQTAAHGCQVSMLVNYNGKNLFNKLLAHGVIADWREPNVIRVAPTPLYNTFEDVWTFGNIIKQIFNEERS